MLKRIVQQLGARRLLPLVLAPGMLTLAFDAWVAHYAGGAGDAPAQIIPVVYGAIAAVVLGIAGLVPLADRAYVRTLASVGVLGLLVGAGGTFFHALSFIETCSGEPITFRAIKRALGLSPPQFAPSAFAGVGVLLLVWPKITRPRSASG